ncbi:MAG: hypothetical protein ACREBJ_04290 [Nitrosotalea sp.]
MKKKQYTREKFKSHDNSNIDYVEISLPDETIDQFLQKYAHRQVTLDEHETRKLRRRKERLIRKIFQAGSLYFTNRQWQIFVHRWIGALKENEIAARLHVDQSYISSVLKACHLKLQKVLGMADKKYLRKKYSPPS